LKADLNLVNLKVHTGESLVEAGISIQDGKIIAVAKPPNLPEADETIDCGGLLAIPGPIDVHVHLRDMELSYKEDFYTGTCAAACGGFTTVLDMPNTRPLTDSPERLVEKMERARRMVVVNVGFYAIPPLDGEVVRELASKGAVAFKVNLCRRWTGWDTDSQENLVEAFRMVSDTGRPVAVHAEEGAMVREAEERLRSSGRSGLLDYVEAHPERAEFRAVRRAIQASINSGVRLHVCHVSTAWALEAVSRAKRFGVPVSCEVTPHHLFLTSRNLEELGVKAVMEPPLRTDVDVEALWRALRTGLVDIVASDHAPHAEWEKTGSVWEVPPGVPGLETTLPLMLDAVNRGLVDLDVVVRALCVRPAEVFGLRGKGRIQPGFDADVVLVDMGRWWKVDPTEFHSKAKYSPFEGWRLMGFPVKTIVNGVVVAEEREVVAEPGSGRVVVGGG